LKDIFGVAKPIIGVVHLLPLPGSVRNQFPLSKILDRALEDATELVQGGIHGVIVENMGDLPFKLSKVEPHTVSAMAIIAHEISRKVQISVGINVLRNDAKAALAIAHSVGAKFIRVNIYSGIMLTSHGIAVGESEKILAYRKFLGANVRIFADILVKHALPLGEASIEFLARETVYRELADALIVSGVATGTEPNLEDLIQVKAAVPDAPVLIGSGARPENIALFLQHADGAIVGSFFRGGGIVSNPVRREKVIHFMKVVNEVS
jgi:hypothetical protein